MTSAADIAYVMEMGVLSLKPEANSSGALTGYVLPEEAISSISEAHKSIKE